MPREDSTGFANVLVITYFPAMAQVEVYHVERSNIDEPASKALLRGDEAHHLLRVRRAQPGSNVVLIDGYGTAWSAELRSSHTNEAEFALLEKYENWREPSVHIHAGIAVLKSDNLLDALDGCTQTGAGEFTPLFTEHSVAGFRENKQRRSERRVLEAAKQCGRGRVPPVHPPQHLEQWCIQQSNHDRRLVFEAGGELVQPARTGESIAIAIGPEGGFSDRELDIMLKSGFELVGLGARRLRAETAAVTAVAALVLPTES